MVEVDTMETTQVLFRETPLEAKTRELVDSEQGGQTPRCDEISRKAPSPGLSEKVVHANPPSDRKRKAVQPNPKDQQRQNLNVASARTSSTCAPRKKKVAPANPKDQQLQNVSVASAHASLRSLATPAEEQSTLGDMLQSHQRVLKGSPTNHNIFGVGHSSPRIRPSVKFHESIQITAFAPNDPSIVSEQEHAEEQYIVPTDREVLPILNKLGYKSSCSKFYRPGFLPREKKYLEEGVHFFSS